MEKLDLFQFFIKIGKGIRKTIFIEIRSKYSILISILNLYLRIFNIWGFCKFVWKKEKLEITRNKSFG